MQIIEAKNDEDFINQLRKLKAYFPFRYAGLNYVVRIGDDYRLYPSLQSAKRFFNKNIAECSYLLTIS